MARDWDEKEHPRVPGGTPGGHGGEFTGAAGWIQAVSAMLPGDSRRSHALIHAPADGRQSTIQELAQMTRGLGDEDGFNRFDGLEFWDVTFGVWRDGSNAYLDDNDSTSGGNELHVDDPSEALGEVSFSGGVIWRHVLPPHEATVGQDQPDPDMEYFVNDAGTWVDGEAVEVDEDSGDWEAYGAPIGSPGEMILARPGIFPAKFDNLGMADPDGRPGARVFVADHLLENRLAWSGGGYEILGDDGEWHTITGIEQNYDVSMSGAEKADNITLRAGSYVIPDLDISDEVTIRRTPL